MKTGSRSNALLVELLIVVLFFMISATVLLQLFSAARMQGEKAGWLNRAGADAQNIAERLLACSDPEKELESMGFITEDPDRDVWRSDEDGFLREVVLDEEVSENGVMKRQQIMIYRNDELLLEIPAAKYTEVSP